MKWLARCARRFLCVLCVSVVKYLVAARTEGDCMETAIGKRRPLGAFALYLAGFAIVWVGYVVFVWRLALVPDSARPLIRDVFLIGAAASWVLWKRPARPLAWLGLWPVNGRQLLITLAVFAAIAGTDLGLHRGIGRLAAASASTLGSSFAGVFVEELMFRGVVLGELSETRRRIVAVLVSALLFLLLHVPGWFLLSMHPGTVVVLNVFFLGVACAVLRLWSASLWPGVAAHWANNLGAMI
jgi:membrane protease YdiL (CAAX protease family)